MSSRTPPKRAAKRPAKKNYAFPLAIDLVAAYLRMVGPATTAELSREIGKNRDSTRKAVNELHDRGRVYIKDWPYTGVQRAALWALRSQGQPDAPKPPPRDLLELKREWNQRNKALLKVRRSVNAARGNPFAMLIR